MAWVIAQDGFDTHRLAAEIANEPQWVVFHDALEEDRWAAHELWEISFAARWWAAAHP